MHLETFWRGIGLAAAFGLAACGQQGEEETAAPMEDAAAPEQVAQYDARTFYETTSYTMASMGPYGSVDSAYVFSPDDSELLITSDASGVFNAQALSVVTGESSALTDSTTVATFALSWFPSDRRILYTADGGGDELNHIYVREETGESRDLTPTEGEQRLKASFIGWAADGESFFISTNERDAQFFDIYRYDAADYSREMIFQNDAGYSSIAVSGDGSWAAVTQTNSNTDSDIFLIDLSADMATPQHISEHEGEINYGIFGFSSDGSELIYATNEFGEFRQAWTHNLESGEKAPLVQADWDVQFVYESPSGRYRITGINADAVTQTEITDTVTGEAVALNDLPPGSITNIRFNSDETKLAFILNTSTSPSNIYVGDVATGGTERLTNALNPAIAEDDLVRAEVVRYASYDGLEIPGILYQPHQASAESPVPALVWVHGGPGGQSRTGYSPTIQHLVNHGYAILAANNRGSSGYGKTFYHLDDKRHGEADLDDIVEARGYLESLEWVDDERIGIIGGSYGGYMVGAALAFRPEAFDVGVNIFGVMNWPRTLKSVPPWWTSRRNALYDELGDPEQEEERLTRISPLFHASNIVKPLLVVQGANDPRVLQQESDEIVAAVEANGVPVEYIVFPDEGHGFRNRENRITASEAYLSFLDTYLKGEGAEATAEAASGH